MKKKIKLVSFLVLVTIMVLLSGSVSSACTIIAVGKNATADGSTMITHSCDSRRCDFRLWMMPERSYPENAARPIVMDSHADVNYGKFPVEYLSDLPEQIRKNMVRANRKLWGP